MIASLTFALSVALSSSQEPDVSTYGAVVFDRTLSREATGRYSTELLDCSTSSMICASGHVLKVVVPRICETYKVGDVFRVGDVQTRVQRYYSDDQAREIGASFGFHPETGLGWKPLAVLGNPERRWSVYIFDDQGLVAIFYDPLEKEDLYTVAEDRGIVGLREHGPSYDHYSSEIRTLRPALQCQSRVEVQND